MTKKTISSRMILGIGIIVLSVVGLTGCDSSSGDSGSDEAAVSNPTNTVSVQASTLEGLAALDVTFTVTGEFVEGVTWDFGDGGEAATTGTESVSHTFIEPGQPTVTAAVTVKTDYINTEVINFTIPITVIPDVNLVVQSFAIDTMITPGGWETVSAIIQNIGSSALTGSGHINVGYFLSTDNVITVDDIYIGDTSIVIGDSFSQPEVSFGFELLSPGENYQYDHQLAVKTNIPAGTYFAGAIVDYIHEYEWYTFPRATDTKEYTFPTHVVVDESNEADNVRVLPAHQVDVVNDVCSDDTFEPDDGFASATPINLGETQVHNFCFDNSDWLSFDATQGGVYKISTSALDLETDTQLILYDRDGSSILLFHDNIGNGSNADNEIGIPCSAPSGSGSTTVDLESGWPCNPESEIVWETQFTGTYYIKIRTTACDEDLDAFCDGTADEPDGSPDGVGLRTQYSISLQ